MRKLVCAVTFWFAAACTETGGNSSSLLAPPNTVIEPDTALAIYGIRTISGTPTTGVLVATDLENALYSICYAEVETALPISCPNSGNLDVAGCSGHECMMQVNVCVGHKRCAILENTTPHQRAD